MDITYTYSEVYLKLAREQLSIYDDMVHNLTGLLNKIESNTEDGDESYAYMAVKAMKCDAYELFLSAFRDVKQWEEKVEKEKREREQKTK